jgi:uncharacterized protein YdeI (YjbR/CyaY-like superfamily)
MSCEDMKIEESIYVTNREDWRAWLEKNHASKKEVWLVNYKKPSTKANIPYDDAVEEALCFGWIDSIIQKIDDEKYARKYTPRVNSAKWSASNKARVAKMIQSGKMTEAGLAKVTFLMPDGSAESPHQTQEIEPVIPEPIRQILMGSAGAWDNFNRLAPSYRRQYIRWIMFPKKIETRIKRAREAVGLLERGEKPGLR